MLFRPGQIVATPGALQLLDRLNLPTIDLVSRHLRGDWGDLCAEDRVANAEALAHGARLLSSYAIGPGGERLWVITEADRSSTCILTPDEY